MNFTKYDFYIGMTMSIAVIFMSFTFPALGLTGDNVNENNIPSFDASTDSYEYMNTSIEYPERPSAGTLTYVNNSEAWEDERQVDLEPRNPRYTISFFDTTRNQENATYEVHIIKFNSSGSYTNDQIIQENEAVELESVDGAYTVGFTNLDIIRGSPNNKASVEWEITSQPSDQSWLGRLPVVGNIISGANQLAAIVGWIGSIIWSFVWNASVLFNNVVMGFINVITYSISFMIWLSSTYSSIITGAPTAWASVIVAIPGILLSFEFMKMVSLGIKLLPFT